MLRLSKIAWSDAGMLWRTAIATVAAGMGAILRRCAAVLVGGLMAAIAGVLLRWWAGV